MTTQRTRHVGFAALFAGLVVLLLAVAGAGTASATAGGPNEDCPAGTTLLAKFEWRGASYVFEEPAGNETVVTITNGTATGGDWTSTTPVGFVLVKGGAGPVAVTTTTYDPPALSGSFDNLGLENGGGNVPDVSNVKFCTPGTTTTSTTTTEPTSSTEETTTTTTTEVPGSVLGSSTVQSTPNGPEVLGEELSRTGSATWPLVTLGAGLVAGGITLLALAKKQGLVTS